LKDVKREQATEGHETGVTAGMAIGDGNVDIAGCIDVLRQHNYDGCLSIECSGVEAMRKSISFLEGIIK